jgi:hypothetical protein
MNKKLICCGFLLCFAAAVSAGYVCQIGVMVNLGLVGATCAAYKLGTYDN